MYSLDKNYLSKRASAYGFIRDTLEKVYRLENVLEYLSSDPRLKGKLALKGGTAINLTIFNLPRLSTDIDLDYTVNGSREEMLQNRNIINTVLEAFMESGGYKTSPKSKEPHSLDSWVYEYVNLGGSRDNIKIEINYSLRAHIFPAKETGIITEHFEGGCQLFCLNALEIFGGKINALLDRAAARDLYDTYNMVRYGLFDEREEQLLRKCVVFYAAISAREINKTFSTKAVDRISTYKIRTELYPVLSKRETFDLPAAQKTVKDYIRRLMILTSPEQEFLERFETKEYKPQLLFSDPEIIDRIVSHPMALWKTRQ